MGKLTKKMLSVIDRGEIRKLVTLGMGLPVKKAYFFDKDAIIDWIYKNPDRLIEADLEKAARPIKQNGSTGFREGTLLYVEQIQGYLEGKLKQPEWPPVPTEELEVGGTSKEEPEDGAPTKTKRSTKTSSPAEVMEIKVRRAAQPAEEGTSKPKMRFKRTNLGKAKKAPEPEPEVEEVEEEEPVAEAPAETNPEPPEEPEASAVEDQGVVDTANTDELYNKIVELEADLGYALKQNRDLISSVSTLTGMVADLTKAAANLSKQADEISQVQDAHEENRVQDQGKLEAALLVLLNMTVVDEDNPLESLDELTD